MLAPSSGALTPRSQEEATKEFQKLAHIYGILGDAAKRKFYDQFGDSGSGVESLEDARQVYEAVMEYINSIHRVQKEDITNFFQQLAQLRKTGELSESEKRELQGFYEQFGGDEKKCVLCRGVGRSLTRCVC